MSEFPSVESDELVTEQFLHAELAELERGLGSEIAELRIEMAERFGKQTVWLVSAVVATSAAVSAVANLG